MIVEKLDIVFTESCFSWRIITNFHFETGYKAFWLWNL